MPRTAQTTKPSKGIEHLRHKKGGKEVAATKRPRTSEPSTSSSIVASTPITSKKDKSKSKTKAKAKVGAPAKSIAGQNKPAPRTFRFPIFKFEEMNKGLPEPLQPVREDQLVTDENGVEKMKRLIVRRPEVRTVKHIHEDGTEEFVKRTVMVPVCRAKMIGVDVKRGEMITDYMKGKEKLFQRSPVVDTAKFLMERMWLDEFQKKHKKTPEQYVDEKYTEAVAVARERGAEVPDEKEYKEKHTPHFAAMSQDSKRLIVQLTETYAYELALAARAAALKAKQATLTRAHAEMAALVQPVIRTGYGVEVMPMATSVN